MTDFCHLFSVQSYSHVTLILHFFFDCWEKITSSPSPLPRQEKMAVHGREGGGGIGGLFSYTELAHCSKLHMQQIDRTGQWWKIYTSACAQTQASAGLPPPTPVSFSANWFIFLDIDNQTKIDLVLVVQCWATCQIKQKYARQHWGGVVSETVYNCMPRVYFVQLWSKSWFMTKFVADHAMHIKWKITSSLKYCTGICF